MPPNNAPVTSPPPTRNSHFHTPQTAHNNRDITSPSSSSALPRPRVRPPRDTDRKPDSTSLSAASIRARRHLRQLSSGNPATYSTISTQRPSSPSSASASGASSSAGYFPSAADFDVRSPGAKFKKGPASHSSNGIETATGPPPALSTQRSYTNDTSRRNQDPNLVTSYTLRRGSVGSTSVSSTATTDSAVDDSDASHKRDSTQTITPKQRSVLRDSRDMAGMSFGKYGEDLLEDDRDRTLRTLEGSRESRRYGRRLAERRYSENREDSNQQGSEDLFLNLARSQSTRHFADDTLSRSESRRSRIAGTSKRQSLPQALTESALQDTEAEQQASPMANGNDRWQPQHARRTSYAASTTSNLRSPLGRSYAATAHPLDSTNSRLDPLIRNDPSPDLGSIQERRDSNMTPGRSSGYRQSNSTYVNGRTPPTNGRSPANFDGTESTASTTAPSTVWDELDDLKSRIRKLELTGKLPSSSSAAVSQAVNERPRTATTTVTTISSSPRKGRHSPSESTVGGSSGVSVHPLLHSALTRSKHLLPPDVYVALEAASADALSLSASLNNSGRGTPSGAQSSVNGLTGSSASERQLRRKADSLCRSLTELCISLSDNTSTNPHQNSTPQSTGRLQPVSILNGGRDTDHPVLPSPSAIARLEARRASQLALSNGNNSPSIRATSSTPTDTPTHSSHIRRSSTLLRHRRIESEEPDDDDPTTRSSTITFRAPSRAATDGGSFIRNSPREYTSQVPLPTEQRSPSLLANGNANGTLPLRSRHYASSSVPDVPPLPLPQSASVQSSLASRRIFADRDPRTPTKKADDQPVAAAAPAPVTEVTATATPQQAQPEPAPQPAVVSTPTPLSPKPAATPKDKRSSLAKTTSLVRKLRAATTSHVHHSSSASVPETPPAVPGGDERHRKG